MIDEDDAGYAPDDSRSPTRHTTDHPRHRSNDSRGERHGPGRGHRSQPDRVVVLADARFWSWLQDDEPATVNAAADAQDTLQQLTHQYGMRLVRTLWYSDQENRPGAAGLQTRRVPSNAHDRGVGMLRAMAQDLAGLAQHRAVDRVLLVSDDDRLLLAVDDAQRRGLMVDMLVDQDSQDLQALQAEEPSWASLLQQADRLVVLGGGDDPMRVQRPRATQPDARLRREAPTAHASGVIEDEILQWWDDESPDQRDHWRQEVQASRGIPQELDRQLLLRISRRLGQALSPAEKSAMRQMVRQQVVGEAVGGQATTSITTPSDA